MIAGAQNIISAVLRILTVGVLAGVLIESGAATQIAETIVDRVGESKSLIALALATFVLTAVGVFIDVAVITVAPIALAIAYRAGLSKPAILLAMIGGGKAGNIISPNPNTIAASDAFELPLTSVMAAGIVPAIFGLIVTVILTRTLINKGDRVAEEEISVSAEEKPSFFASIVGPLAAIVLLALRPVFGITIDPLIALPIGGAVGALVMGKIKYLNKYSLTGLAKMGNVAILLIGTGTIAGIVANSGLRDVIINGLQGLGLPAFVLAPAAGILMSGATASTTAGTAVASSVFGSTILGLGISRIAGPLPITAVLLFGSFTPQQLFHATGGSVFMNIKDRLKIIPYESLIGLVLTIVSTIIFGIIYSSSTEGRWVQVENSNA